MTDILAPAGLPASDADPFAHDVLEDPSALHAQLRDAGPVVYLTRYDVYAMARYDQVRAALADWQELRVRRGRRAQQLPLRDAMAAPEPAAGGGPATARRPPRRTVEGAGPAGAEHAAGVMVRRR